MSTVLRIEHLTKRFPGVVALEDVSLDVRAGEVHAIVGENGAGKSTLINIVSGVFSADAGRILLDNQPAGLDDPVTARNRGVYTVHQEAELFGTLSVAENMALSVGLPTIMGLVQWPMVYERARQAVAPLSRDFDVRQRADRLSVAERHLTQVAAAVAENARIVILDEPTSVLTARETNWLFAQIDRLRSSGVGIVYISHRQEEIFQLADRISVLRDGRLVWSGAKSEIDSGGLVEKMVGRAGDLVRPRISTPERAADLGPSFDPVARLRLSGLSDADGRFHDVSLEIRRGEILGLYGLIGSGRTELAQAVFGLRKTSDGSIAMDGRPISLSHPMDAVRAGIAYLPEDRLRQAVCRGLSVRENAVLASLGRWGPSPIVFPSRERNAVAAQAQRFRIRMTSQESPIEQLSGGNQQKVVLARWVLTQPRVLLLDEPTRGVDVAAKAEIHQIIRELANQGCAVLLISSELEEVLAHSDQLGVFREGRLVRVAPSGECTAVAVAADALPKATEEASAAANSRQQSRRTVRPNWLAEMGLAVVVVGFIGLLCAMTDGKFQSPANLTNLLNNLSSKAILALAAASVILAGGIDISIGSLLALSAAVGGVTMKAMGGGTDAIAFGIAAGLGVGAAGGFLNAALANLGRIHPIVVTLGTMTIFRGLLRPVTGGNQVAELPADFSRLTSFQCNGVTGSAIVLVVATASTYLWLSHTRWGRHVYAVGSSPTAARLVGISRSWTWLMAYTVAGLLVGLAGLLELAQNGSMQPTMGKEYELGAIAAAVIGGVAIQGGRGNVFGVLLGAILLVLIENSLVLWQVSGERVGVAIGGLLVAAIVLDWFVRRMDR